MYYNGVNKFCNRQYLHQVGLSSRCANRSETSTRSPNMWFVGYVGYRLSGIGVNASGADLITDFHFSFSGGIYRSYDRGSDHGSTICIPDVHFGNRVIGCLSYLSELAIIDGMETLMAVYVMSAGIIGTGIILGNQSEVHLYLSI